MTKARRNATEAAFQPAKRFLFAEAMRNGHNQWL